MNTIWIAVGALTLLGLVFGAILGYASRRFAVEDDPVVEKSMRFCRRVSVVSAAIPAVAPTPKPWVSVARKSIVAPGGEAVMLKMAELLNVEPQPCDGEEQQAAPVRMLAVIDENNCIGCTKCIQACPVDAIVGATRHAHGHERSLYWL